MNSFKHITRCGLFALLLARISHRFPKTGLAGRAGWDFMVLRRHRLSAGPPWGRNGPACCPRPWPRRFSSVFGQTSIAVPVEPCVLQVLLELALPFSAAPRLPPFEILIRLGEHPRPGVSRR